MGITVASLIERERVKAEMPEQQLIYGLGSRGILRKLEQAEAQSDKLLCDILLQRLGKSPDKLEYILSWQEYRKECIRSCFEDCVFKKNKRWAERVLKLYTEKVEMRSVHQMYIYRAQGMIAYWIDRDLEQAEECFLHAIETTMPFWQEKDWLKYRISGMELENVFAWLRVREERCSAQTVAPDTMRTLEKCRAYHRRIYHGCGRICTLFWKVCVGSGAGGSKGTGL